MSHLGHCVYFDGMPNVRAILLSKPEGKDGVWGIECRRTWNSTEWVAIEWTGNLDEAERVIHVRQLILDSSK
jgi:hypothetical protein